MNGINILKKELSADWPFVDEFCIEREEIVLFGKCFHPEEENLEKHPAILLNHEFASNMASTSRYARIFSKLGYHVFVFDFTGSKGTKSYGREDIDASILTDKEEMEMVYEFMIHEKYVDKNHIILGGCSQGGLTAALVAADHKEEVEALLMYYPAICAPDYLRRGYMMGISFDTENVPEYIEMYRGTGIGRKYVRDVITLDPWKEITRFEKPVLICHGTWDTIADISYSREAVKRYHDCHLLEIPSGEHIFKVPENFNLAINETIDFLQNRISS
ncbi:MAG: alpha/beta hydrolase [Eubacteriales bacterium]|nr:alpha/beta hydrolase [Eubacteriales bacterium]